MNIQVEIKDSKVLIVEDDKGLGQLLTEEVQDNGMEALWCSSAEEALNMLNSWNPDLVVSDLRLPGMDGLQFLQVVRDSFPDNQPDFLIITAFGTISKAVETLKAGAEDFLTKPLDLDHFMLTLERVLRNRALRLEVMQIKSLLNTDSFHDMYGQSRSMRFLFDQISRVADADGPVLVLGESGTGKELVARAIHAESKRAKQPFLAVNCAGIPEHLLESEFFGHKAGAFTGASKTRQGLFAEAHKGTLLLDEISEMPLFMQAKLLRLLQDGKVRPVGGNVEEQVDVRILAATHRDLEEEVREGHFREDLFYRLETFTLRVPPLRERESDLELLAERLLRRFCVQTGKKIQGFSEQALQVLENYHFPGNVRELQNAVERAVTFCDGSEILPRHLPARIRDTRKVAQENISGQISQAMFQDKSLPPLCEVEQRYIQHVLDKVGGNKRRAASILGIGRRTLYRRLGEEVNG
ncbi:sigma-54 dependent transcriptional regulator [Desulfonatronospira sp.]|uniref:sigma-54-dependent transcriptional regulator n=1 Tax=Desulfonatronospira sp. TaxID=1962951 RepID=UPI0025BD6C6A|nr:sigma-54 dependent transcriptional regulator [Desulfonatronospira sp.]